MKEKVLAYVYRKSPQGIELLVFDHPGIPEVNPQVPAGTLNDGENPEEGVLREVYEETGLKFNSIDNDLGKFEYWAQEKEEMHLRHVFTFMSDNLPEKWTHRVTSNDLDDGEEFHFYWLPLEEAKQKLVGEQGKYLPTVNGHFVKAKDILLRKGNESFKIMSDHANISHYFGLKKVAAHYHIVPSGYRTSEPHAESLEEEFVMVLSGEIDLWLNGQIKTMKKGDCIGFPAGTGVGHCFINNSGSDCEIFVSGDRTKEENQCHFHLDPELAHECGDFWWSEMPCQNLGGHDGLPGSFTSDFYDSEITTINAYEDIPVNTFSYPDDKETFSDGKCLSRPFGMKNIAIWIERIPKGKRTSRDHAHSVEEEFVFVLEGEPIVRLDGTEYRATPYTGIDFKAGSGVAHTLYNDSENFVYYLCVGECEPEGDKIYYPNHPKRNEEMRKRGALWER